VAFPGTATEVPCHGLRREAKLYLALEQPGMVTVGTKLLTDWAELLCAWPYGGPSDLSLPS